MYRRLAAVGKCSVAPKPVSQLPIDPDTAGPATGNRSGPGTGRLNYLKAGEKAFATMGVMGTGYRSSLNRSAHNPGCSCTGYLSYTYKAYSGPQVRLLR